MENDNSIQQTEQVIQSENEPTVQQSEVNQSMQVAQVEYAGFWVRFAAVLVDGLVLLIPTAIVNATSGREFGGLAGTILMWVYAIYMLSTKQATLGKMAVGIKVTTTDGGKPEAGKLILREVVGKILNMLTLYIGFLMIAFTKKKQGLHDMIAGTVVVYDSTRKRRPWLVILGIVFALLIPIGIIASVVLVSLNSARSKAINEASKQEQLAKDIQKQIELQK